MSETLDLPVVLLSHRGPVSFEVDADGDRTVTRGAGGLVTALTGLTAYLDDPTITQSALEDRFLRLCRRYRIPTPVTQHGRKPRVDFAWPDRRLIVEVDGWQAHRTRVAFQDDRTNTNRLQLAGNVVLRYTWDDVRIRHAEVAAQVLYAGKFSSTHSGPISARRYGWPPTST